MVSTHPPTSKSSSPFNNPLMTVPKARSTIGIIVTFMFHFFFQFLSKAGVFILLFTFFPFSTVFRHHSKVYNFAILFFFFLFIFIIIRSGLLAEIRWSVCMSKSHGSLCMLFSRIYTGLCMYHLFVWANFNFFHISKWINWPTQSCLVLYSFCVNLLHSLIMWLMVFVSISTQPSFAISLHLIYSRFDMIGSYGVVLCCY